MDCRKFGFCLALGLVGAGGCQHGEKGPQIAQGHSSTPVVSAAPVVMDRSVVKEEAAEPVRPPKAKTLVALATFRANEAKAPNLPAHVKHDHQEVARKSYQQALEVDPKYLPAYRGLGQLYLAMNDPRHAIETYHRGLAIQPDSGALWYELAMIHNRQREWGPAIEALDRAVESDPENRRYVNTRGYTLARAGRFDEAYRCFAQITTEARAHYQLARMQTHLGQKELARQQLTFAVAKDPRLNEARELLGRITPAESDIRRVGHTAPGGPPGR